MNIEILLAALPDYAKDMRLNLVSLLQSDAEQELSAKQIVALALVSAYATQNSLLIQLVQEQAATVLSNEEIASTKAAATIMAMNNIYYRFVHLAEDAEIQALPARLRMNILANPGIDKVDFELLSLAVSAINGCGMCIKTHVKALAKTGVQKTACFG